MAGIPVMHWQGMEVRQARSPLMEMGQDEADGNGAMSAGLGGSATARYAKGETLRSACA